MIKKGAITILITMLSGAISIIVYAGKFMMSTEKRLDRAENKIESIHEIKLDLREMRTDIKEILKRAQ